MITLLCDSHAIGYRAYHSLGALSHEGNATEVPYGFLTLVLQLAEQYKTNSFVFCFDSPGSKRKELFPEYKAARESKTDEEREERKQIHAQFDALRKDILPAMGFSNVLFQMGYEADDLIALIVIDNPAKKFGVVSSDHDLYQLLRFKNCMFQHRLSGEQMTASRFMAEYRIPVRDWTMVKCIAGCDGDGVPGIEGVGETTAIKYLLGELNGGKKELAILQGSDVMRRNYELVRLPHPGVRKVELKKDELQINSLFPVFSDLGFDSFTSGENENRWDRFCEGEWK